MKLLQKKLYEIIFEADTREGKLFDAILLGVILFSITLVMLESIDTVHARYAKLLRYLEWGITVVFTLEYIVRILVVDRPFRYVFSFFGLIDLLAILPTFINIFVAGGHSLIVIRAIRLLRVFRIFKLNRYTTAGRIIVRALRQSREKIGVFLIFILTLVTIIGTLMYLIEGESNGFKSIPTSIYWAIVTITTVGFGDITPVTPAGQFIASLLMIMGYSIIAVPTGIVTAGLITAKETSNTQVCSSCLYAHHDDDAHYCKKCGTPLYPVDL